ncbi:MAG: helix-turn-helix domain-containing protein [Clostridiales Family XIII bacterium]|nr:helix-turn-helix domain-containing protein [Clostridiales Family XIII bacterium]
MNWFKDARQKTGLSQGAMSDAIGIPVRTIQEWEQGRKDCPDWTKKLILAEVERIKHRMNTWRDVGITATSKHNEVEGVTTFEDENGNWFQFYYNEDDAVKSARVCYAGTSDGYDYDGCGFVVDEYRNLRIHLMIDC